MPELGVTVSQAATSVAIPASVKTAIPYFIGATPSHAAENPAPPMRPVLATSYAEAVSKLGYSNDWEKYPGCQAIYSHFVLFAAQPAIFINPADPTTCRTEQQSAEITLTERRGSLPLDAILSTLIVKLSDDGSPLTPDVDYAAFYDGDALIVEALPGGAAESADTLQTCYASADPSKISRADIVEAINMIDHCMTACSVIPDLIVCPDWCEDPAVAAVMIAKAPSINNLFRAKAIIDIPSTDSGVTSYDELLNYKNQNNLVSPDAILCWPKVRLADQTFSLSVQLAGLMAQIDGQYECPMRSPSNKNLQMNAACLADGSEVMLSKEQTDYVAGYWGVVTAMNFMSTGWIAKGNYTACFPSNTDVKDQFIPVSRMFDWIGNTLIQTFWSRLDDPMNARLKNTILDSCNIWLAGLVSSEKLLGARVEMRPDENPLTDLLAGIIRFHIYLAPAVPMQKLDFILEYDASYVEAALG